MKILKSLLTILMMVSLISSNCFSQFKTESRPAQHLVITNAHEGGHVRISTSYIQNSSPQEITDLVNQIQNTKNSDQNIIISTDSAEVVKDIVSKDHYQKQSESTRPVFLLYDKILNSKAVRLVGDQSDRVQKGFSHSLKNDPLGVFIALITIGTESFYWLSAESVPLDKGLTQAAFSVLVGITFGFDKDLWSRLTKPGQKKILSVLNFLSRSQKGETSKFSKLTSQFLANMGLSVGFQAVRLSFLSFDQLTTSLMSPDFYGKAFVLGTLLTASGFAWSEQLEQIDKIKNPVAKSIFRRVCEIRGLIMANLAPSAQITQPQVYGFGPWWALAVHGSIGLFSMLNSERLVGWIEKNPIMIKVQTSIEKIENAFIQRKIAPNVKDCRSLILNGI